MAHSKIREYFEQLLLTEGVYKNRIYGWEDKETERHKRIKRQKSKYVFDK